jgi:hypothetical protein
MALNFLNNSTLNGTFTVSGNTTLSTIPSVGSNTDKFLMSNNGLISFATAAEVLTYIGGAPASGGDYLPLAGGTMDSGANISMSGTLFITSSIPRIIFNDSDGTNQIGEVFASNGNIFFDSRDGNDYGSFSFVRTNNTGSLTAMDITSADGDVRFFNSIQASGYIKHLGDTNTAFGFPANNTIAFDTNNSERMRINSVGAIRFNAYGAGTLVTDVDGNITVSSGGSGTVTGITEGPGITVTASATSPTVAVDYIGTDSLVMEAADAVPDQDDYIIFGADSSGSGDTNKIQFTDVNLSLFNNDSGFTSNAGTVTSVGSGAGLTGGPFTVSGSIAVDYVGTDSIIKAAPTASASILTSDFLLIATSNGNVYETTFSNLPLDNYNRWRVQANTGSVYNVVSDTNVDFIGGTNISTSTGTQAGGLTVTINNDLTNNTQLTNGAGYITASSTNTLTNKSGLISQWTNDSGYVTGGGSIGDYLPLAGGTMANTNLVTNMNADLLDGINSTSFLRSDAADTADQRIVFSANASNNWDTIATASGSQGGLEVFNMGSGNDAFMAFHAGADFAFYFGIDADNNQLSVGGWSMGANKYKVWSGYNDGAGSGLDADLLDAQQGSYYLDYNNATNKPTIVSQVTSGNTSTITVGGGSTTPTIAANTGAVSSGSANLATGAQIQTAINTATTGVLSYQGTWNASTNSPALASGVGTPGYYYIVSTAGSTNLDGITDWAVGDWAVFSDLATDAWQKIDNTQVGNVTGSGANQRLAFWNSTSNITSDEELTWDGVNLNIGTFAGTGDCELRLFGSTPNNSFSTLKTTNGNLHIDSDNGHSIYLNYYLGGSISVVIGNGAGGSSGTQFYANGTVSTGGDLTVGGGDITLSGSGARSIQSGGDIALKTSTGDYAFYGAANGNTNLYYNGLQKLRTGSVGVVVTGNIELLTIANETSAAGKFLVPDSNGVVKYRTAAEVLSDIGGAPATGGSYLPLAGGNMTGQINAQTINFDGIVNSSAAGGLIGRNHAYDTLELKGYGSEMMIGSQGTHLHVNYRTCNNGAASSTPTDWFWRAGSSTSFSNHSFGTVTATGLKVDTFSNNAGNLIFSAGNTTTGAARSLNLRISGPTGDPSASDDTNSTGITWGQRTDSTPYYIIYPQIENYNSSGNYSKLTLAWHTGIKIGAATNYGGTRFYSNSPDVAGAAVILNVGVGNSNIGVVNNLTVGGQATGPAPTTTTSYANKAYVDAHGGGVGPFLPIANPTFTGTLTGPTAVVTGNIKAGSLTDNAFTRFTNPDGATYITSASSVTGAIEIIMPVTSWTGMFSFNVEVYEYSTNKSFTLKVGGHLSGTTWYNVFSYLVSNPGANNNYNIRFGRNAAGNAVVYVGELAETWSYPQVWVTNLVWGYSGSNVAYASGWDVNFKTAFEGVTQTRTASQVGYQQTANTANSVVLRDGSGNFSAGTITAALSGNATTATNASYASRLTHNANRTDSASYPVIWMETGSTSPAYSCAAVTITSSVGQVNATTFNGALTGNASTVTNGVYITGTQTITGLKVFDDFHLQMPSKTVANFNDLNNSSSEIRLFNVYNLATASTGMLSTYGTLFQINGQASHDKTQFAFNGSNGSIQYRKSWYPNTAWTSFRTIWDSNNDGAGSGLDADLLDGQQGSYYVNTATTQSIAGAKTFTSTPISVTRSTADNSTYLATTEFVKNQGYITGSYLPLAGGTMTGPLVNRRINLNRSAGAGGQLWYSSSYTSWQNYMNPGGGGAGYGANITAPTGTYVTSWALRSFIEGASGYGWTWEQGTASSTTPSIVAELSSTSGNFKTIGNIYASGGNSTQWNTHTSNTGTISSINATTNGGALGTSNTLTGNGTMTLAWQGNTASYVRGDGSLATFPSIPQGDVTGITVSNGITGSSLTGPVPAISMSGTYAGNFNFTTNNFLVGGTYASNSYDTTAAGVRILLGGGNSDSLSNYYIGTNSENFGGNYTKLDLAWHTGIRMGAQASYGGVRIFDSEDFGTVLFSVGTSGTGVVVSNTLTVTGGNIVLGGISGRIQGVVSVLSGSDATSKTYVDGNFLPKANPTFTGTLTGPAATITTVTGALAGNASTSTTFSTGRTNYKGATDGAVAGQLMWKEYGNNHTIFDASDSTSPSGGSVNNTNSNTAWSATYPTLMGWNGSSTYGVRVDSARLADNATLAGGLAIESGQTNNGVNKIVRTSVNGYVNFGWINSASGATTSTITRITASNDAYLRYVTPATFRSQVIAPYFAPSSTVSGVTSIATTSPILGGTITGAGTLSLKVPVSGAWHNGGVAIVGAVTEVGRYIDFHTSNTGTSDYDIRLDANGSELNCSGNIRSQGNLEAVGNIVAGRAKFTSGTAALPSFSFTSDPDTGLSNPAANTIQLSTGGSYRWSVNNSATVIYQNVGIGVTPLAKFHVNGTSLVRTSTGVGDFYLGNVGTANHFRFHTNNSNTYFDMNCGNIYWRQGSSSRYTFFPSTANMTVNGTITQNSDIRIKENVVEIGDCISKVQAMRGVYYNRTDFNTKVTKVGVIAQEVEAVLPELILESPEDGFKSVAYSELTAVLINAIKEQQEIIEDLKTRITKLEK